jgi:GT2 family glycosyltransferase
MSEEPKKILVAIPTGQTLFSEFALALRLLRIPPDYQVAFAMAKKANADIARNSAAEITTDEVDYIFYLDDDILVPDNALEKLLSHGKDIVSGLYFRNNYPFLPMLYKKQSDRYEAVIDYEKNKLIEVDACGTGCTLIKAEVFKKLDKPYFKNNEADGGFSEDLYFCKKAKEAGFTIHCDTSINCAHMSSGPIDNRTWDNVKERVKKEREK